MDTRRASILSARRPCVVGFTPASSVQGRSGFFRTEREQQLAGPRPSQAEIDALELGGLAVALVLDQEAAALQADFGQVAAVEAQPTEAVEPSQESPDMVHGGRRRRTLPRTAVFACRHTGLDGGKRRRRRERPGVGGGEHGDAAVGANPHRQIGTDQIEAFGTRMAGEQARTGEADLGARGARHDAALAVSQDDVADAQGGAAIFVPFEHGAAELDLVATAEVLLDGRGEPWRGEIERNRAAGEAQPQDADRDAEHRRDGADRIGQARRTVRLCQ